MEAKVYVTLKKSVLDPQGKTVKHGLESLGFEGVEDVRVGKYLVLKLEGESKEEVEKKLKSMCEELLVNLVIEDYEYEIGG